MSVPLLLLQIHTNVLFINSIIQHKHYNKLELYNLWSFPLHWWSFGLHYQVIIISTSHTGHCTKLDFFYAYKLTNITSVSSKIMYLDCSMFIVLICDLWDKRHLQNVYCISPFEPLLSNDHLVKRGQYDHLPSK